MEVVNPEVMRVTPVSRALEQFAAALRGGSVLPQEPRKYEDNYILESLLARRAVEENPHSCHPLQWHRGSFLGFSHRHADDGAVHLWNSTWD